jgi:23S rRNA (guanosine2251-2'-O)-methyltransferase
MRSLQIRKAPRDGEVAGHDIIYGAHPVEAVLANPKRTVSRLWATKNALDRLKERISELPVEPEVVHPRSLDSRLGADAVHQGLLVETAPLPQPRLDEIARDGIVVLLDQVTDPHNVGAILRSCAAFAVSAVVTTARHSAETSGVLFKAASGATELVSFVKVTNLARAMEELKSYGFHIAGLEGSAARSIESAKLKRPLALAMGAEGKGLRHLTRQTCDELVRLDLPGPIKSLNVSNACALALYAVSRPDEPRTKADRL